MSKNKLAQAVGARVACPTVPEMLTRQLDMGHNSGSWNLRTLPYVGGFGSNVWYNRTMNWFSFPEGPARAWVDILGAGGYSPYQFGRLTYEDTNLDPKLDWAATAALVNFNAEAALKSTGNWTRVPMLNQDAILRIVSRLGSASTAGYLFRLALVIGCLCPPTLDSALPEYPGIVHVNEYYWGYYWASNYNAGDQVVRVTFTDDPAFFNEVGGIIWSPQIANLSPTAQACLLWAFAAKWRLNFTHGPMRAFSFRTWDTDATTNTQNSVDQTTGDWYKYASFIMGRDNTAPFQVTVLVDNLATGFSFMDRGFNQANPFRIFTAQDIANLYNGLEVRGLYNVAQELYQLVRLTNPTEEEWYWFMRGMAYEWGDRTVTWRTFNTRTWRQPNVLDHAAPHPGVVNDPEPNWQIWAYARAGDGLPVFNIRPVPPVRTSPFFLRIWGFSAGQALKVPTDLVTVRTEAWKMFVCGSWVATPAMTRPADWGVQRAVYRKFYPGELRIPAAPTAIMDLWRDSDQLCGANMHYSMRDYLSVDSTPEPKVINVWTVDRAGGEFVCITQDFGSRPFLVGYSRDLIEARYGHQLMTDAKVGYRVAYVYHPDVKVQFNIRMPSSTGYKPQAKGVDFTEPSFEF